MPPKKDGKKKGLKERKREEEKLQISRRLKELRASYELSCAEDQSLCHPDIRNQLKKYIEEGQLFTKLILTEIPPQDYLEVKVLSVIAAIRRIRYLHLKDLLVWDVPVKYEDFAALNSLLQQPAYSLSYLELIDCKIDSFSIGKFKECLSTCNLSGLVLDFNKFGDAGCKQLCAGLEGNCKLIKLSLKFCELTSLSGTFLGKTVNETAVSELYVDGNKLQCEGLIELIKMVADKAEEESIAREKEKEEAAATNAQRTGARNFLGVSTTMSTQRSGSAVSTKSTSSARPTSVVSAGRKTGKRKKSSKKKSPPVGPKVGPWLSKLHISDNGIDSHGVASKYAPVLCMRAVTKWLENAENVRELNIDDNLIGEMGGREILHGLQSRKEADLSNITVWVTHRMEPDTFNKIVALGTAGKKKSKKKGKAGKKRT